MLLQKVEQNGNLIIKTNLSLLGTFSGGSQSKLLNSYSKLTAEIFEHYTGFNFYQFRLEECLKPFLSKEI